MTTAQSIDLHFLLQPTTLPSDSGAWVPQAVLSLVIEINPKAAPADVYPFKTLVDGVANWLYDNHKGDGSLPAQIDNIVAYVKAGFSADVEACLRDRFTFSIRPSGDTSTDTSVAVFSMFPELKYNYAPLGTVDFSSLTVPAGYVEQIAKYFSNTDDSVAAVAAGTSFAGLVRTDYFVLLAKQLGSDLQNILKKTPAPTTFADALTSVNYTALAGVLSRFMQHGLRLPDPASASAQKGLYELTGQQVALQQTPPNPTPQWATEVTLLPGEGAAGWITLVNAGNSNASITSDLPVDLVSKLAVAVQPAWIQNSLRPLEPLNSVPLKYTLIQPISVTHTFTGDTLSARAIPHAIQVEVAAATNQMYLQITEGAASGTTQASNDAPPPPAAPFNAVAVLLARIGIRQLQKPGAPAGTFYDDVFQLMGTDDQTRGMIDALLDGGPSSFTIDLLLPQGQSAYNASTDADNVVLAKVNLSTVSEPQTSIMLMALAARAESVSPNFATTADAEDFLRLIWECSVVHTGGFFLHCEHIPPAQFVTATGPGGQASNAPGEASLYVLVNFAPFGTLPDNEPAVSSYHNAVFMNTGTVQRAVAATVMSAGGQSQKTPVLTWRPNFPAGSTGFQVTWPEAPYNLPPLTSASSSDDVSNYLEMLYHFLQYRLKSLPGATAALPSNWSAPAGAGSIPQADGTHSWYFRQSVAVAKFIGENANRYAAVGQPAELDVRLLDVFGNTLPDALVQKVTPTVVYNDPLFSFAHWPGVHIGYQIAKGTPDPALTIHMTYTPNSASDPGGDRAQQTIRTYQSVLDQLDDPNTSATIATTLEQQPLGQTAAGTRIKDELRTYVGKILDSLNSAKTDTIPLSLVLNLTGSFAYVKGLPSDLFVVRVEGVVARASAQLDPTLVSLLPRIGMVRHEIFPDLTVTPPAPGGSNGGADTQSDGDRVFAEAFEAAYFGFDGADGLLKIGGGPQPGAKEDDDEDAPVSVIDKVVWALRWSSTDGVDVKFANSTAPDIQQKPAYFAPTPLNTELITQSCAVRQYGDTTTDLTHRFSDIDLDDWMSQFLSAVHSLFEAEMAPAIAKLDPAAYDTLIAYKEAIADSLSQRLENVFVAKDPHQTPSPLPAGDPAIAQETFRQALLTSLTNDYATAAVVQVPAQVAVAGKLESPVAGHDGEKIPARLFGKVSANKPDAGTNPYTISPASLPIPNGQSTGYPTFLVTAKQPKNQADLNLQLFFDVGFLEHDFDMLEGHYGYIPSSWVTFSLPQAKPGGGSDTPTLVLPMGEVDVPIPLRAFPQAPTLFQQKATADTGTDPLSQLDWDYELTVSTLRDVAQDELWLELTFNDLVNATDGTTQPAPGKGGGVLGAGGTTDPARPLPADLFEALARFVWEYPQILPGLETIPTRAYSGSQDGAADLALQRMASLILGVKETVDNWKDPAHPEARASARRAASNPSDYVPHFSWQYKIEPEKGHDGSPTGNLLVTRTMDDQSLLPPWPTINGYSTPSTSEGQGLYELSATEPAQWVVTWKGLYLMTHQSARAAAWIERNDDLSENPDLKTNEAFIYKTPVVTFGSPIVPLIDLEAALPQPAQPTFIKALSDVFAVFTQTDSDQRVAAGLRFTLETGYEYVVASQQGDDTKQLTTRAPIFLARGEVATPTNKTGTPPQTLDEFEKSAAETLQQWQAAQHPNPTGAFISLRLTMFATVSDGQLPLAVFRDIQLPVGADGSWWAAGGN